MKKNKKKVNKFKKIESYSTSRKNSFDWNETQKHLKTLPDTKAKIKYLIEQKTEYEQQDGFIFEFSPTFAEKCELEIKKLKSLAELESSPTQTKEVPQLGQYSNSQLEKEEKIHLLDLAGLRPDNIKEIYERNFARWRYLISSEVIIEGEKIEGIERWLMLWHDKDGNPNAKTFTVSDTIKDGFPLTEEKFIEEQLYKYEPIYNKTKGSEINRDINLKTKAYIDFLKDILAKKYKENSIKKEVLPPQPSVESPFSVLQWATIFYYADETKLLPESRFIKTRMEQFMRKHQVNTTFDNFKTKYYEAKRRINEKNNYPINKLELIIPFLKENYKQTVTKVENDITILKENKPEY